MWLTNLKAFDVQLKHVVPLRVIASYITLSYVWGGITSPRDEEIFIENDKCFDYSAQGLFFKLPLTLRNAVELVRRLGKRFLWVDALCIDQADQAEAKEQINQMGLICSLAF
jgi:hypothetical protein